MNRDPMDIWRSEVSEASEVALNLAVHEATRKAFSMCKEAFPGYQPLEYAVGWNRFTALQHGLLVLGKSDASFKSKPLFHANGLPFTQLYTKSIHITTAPADSENAYPKISLFRQQELERQVAFFNGARTLTCHLNVSSGRNLGEPDSVRIHILDGLGGYLDDYIDIKIKTAAPSVIPVEKVTDDRQTSRPERKDLRSNEE